MAAVAFMVVFVVGAILLERRLKRRGGSRGRVVRRFSDENPDEVLGRTPASRPCDCGKPRCPHKGKVHPRGPNRARRYHWEGVSIKFDKDK